MTTDIQKFRAAYVTFRREHGLDAMLAIVKQVAGVSTLGEVPAEKYDELIAAFAVDSADETAGDAEAERKPTSLEEITKRAFAKFNSTGRKP
jgi:hypothetical protein